MRFIDELWAGRIAPHLYARQARQRGRQERDRSEHAEIARLIAEGDAAGAASAVDRHLAGALESLLD